MLVWFREFVEQMQTSAKQLAESQWMRVGRGINETIEDATAVFEDRKKELEAAAAAHLSQVGHLEEENGGSVLQRSHLRIVDNALANRPFIQSAAKRNGV